MYLYIELWSPRENWLSLSEEKRKAMVDQMIEEARKNPITGVIPVSVREVGDHIIFDGVRERPAVIDDAVPRPTGFRYVSAYMIPTLELVHRFEQRVESLGWWFEYFDQDNAWGKMDERAVLGEMASPPPGTSTLRKPSWSAARELRLSGGASANKPLSIPPPRSSASSGQTVTAASALPRPSAAEEEFDFVIIGAGSAGCVLGSRLSEDPDVTVLLLEAGGPEQDPSLDEVQLMGSELDWAFRTEPEPNLGNRRIDWPRGKALGGSSAIAGRIYMRGNRLDFEGWKGLGNDGWGYEDVLRFFKRAESNQYYSDLLHGNDGPMNVESVIGKSTLRQAFLAAAEACGLRSDPHWDFNGKNQDGVAGYYQYIQKNAMRQSVAAAYLTSAVVGRPNLTIRDRCLTKRILVERNRAVGVEYVGTDWQARRVRARREVVLSAGAVGSAHLLMLSGIGPAHHLRSLGIPIAADLPGVGQNLQDHLQFNLAFRPSAEAGTVGHLGGSNGLFVRSQSRKESSQPDLQLFGVEAFIPAAVFGLEPGPTYLVTASLVQPYSRGEITLRSSDPLDKPRIQANYLKDGRDLSALLDGIEWIRKLAASEPLQRVIEREVSPGPGVCGREQLTAAIRQRAGSNYHPVGTCKMGVDHRAVVDPELRVRGLKGLRVADASIMPKIVNGNTNAASIMIGEKAAELIGRDGSS